MTGAALSQREQGHDDEGRPGPAHSQRAGVRVRANGQHDGRLDGEVEREGDERGADEAQGAVPAVGIDAGELPHHHHRGEDLDEGVEPETDEGHRPSRACGDGEDDDPGHVPDQRRPLQRQTPSAGRERVHSP